MRFTFIDLSSQPLPLVRQGWSAGSASLFVNQNKSQAPGNQIASLIFTQPYIDHA
jgi:hypothetical protein